MKTAPQMSFDEAVSYLSSLQNRGWRLGLDRMLELASRAGLCDALGGTSGPQFIHVAGTNGKGSVTAYLQSMLTASGYRTGGFFSPFVYDIRERVQLDCSLISRDDFARIASDLVPIAAELEDTELGGVTEFEFKTAMGLNYWKEKRADWVALEVGLGGRLDATNIVTPRCSVIVSIGLDHMEHLGSTIPHIATEKAGIFKLDVPAVVGDVNPEAWAAIEKIGRVVGSPIWRFGRDFQLEREQNDAWRVCTPARTRSGLSPSLYGPDQPHNMAVAIAAIDAANVRADDDAIREGVAKTILPGRFELRENKGMQFVLDGAHNADAAHSLAQATKSAFPNKKAVLITGMVAGHDPVAFYRPLADLIHTAHVSPIEFNRARNPNDIATALRSLGINADAHSSSRGAIDAAMSDASSAMPLLVTGSFYLVGEIGNLLRDQ